MRRSGISRRVFLAASTVAFAQVASACGGGDSRRDAGSGGQAQEVSLRLDWLLNGYSVPFVVAANEGFYEERGLGVTVLEGKGSGTTTQLVGNGSETFGVVDLSTAALLISQGVPVQAVGGFLQTSPNGIAFVADETSIESPADLAGKVFGFAQGEAPLSLLPAVLEKNGMSKDDVETRLMDPSAKVSALLRGQVDGIGSFSAGSFTNIEAERSDAEIVLYSDWGVNTLSIGIIAAESTISEDPDLVRAFVEGSVEGWEWALENPEEAVDIAVRQFPEANPDALLLGLQASEDLLHTRATEGKPLGWMAEEDWQSTVNLMAQFGGLEEPRPPAEYFTNEFTE